MKDAETNLGGLGAAPETAPELPEFEPLEPFDFAEIKRTQFLYNQFYARGYMSLTIAAPKVGKSQLALAEAMDMASGGKVFGFNVEPRRVVYFCAEDDMEILRSRYAANCVRHGIDQAEFDGKLTIDSGINWPDFFLIDQQDRSLLINETVFKHIEEQIKTREIDVLVLDPLQDLSHADESNEAFRLLGLRVRRLASQLGIAVHIIHHTRKVAPGLTPSIDDARGGSALRGVSRFNRVLVGMSESEAVNANIEDARYYFRIGDVESNLAPPSSARNRWFEKKSTPIPNGDDVASLCPWEWPDDFEGITLDMAVQAYNELAHLDRDSARHSNQAGNWFGFVVAGICNITIPPDRKSDAFKAARSKVGRILAQWVENSWLEVGEFEDTAKGKTIKFYTQGEVHPNAQ